MCLPALEFQDIFKKTSSSAPGIFPFLNGDVNVAWAGCGSSLLWHFFPVPSFEKKKRCALGLTRFGHKKIGVKRGTISVAQQLG